MTQSSLLILCQLGLKNQQLISRSLDWGLIDQANTLQSLDRHLSELLNSFKQANGSYIWHMQADDRVRPSHAANNGKVYSFDDPPPTGNPGEDFGCRCWAEPLGHNEYARQILISAVKDNPEKWTDLKAFHHYQRGNGKGVTLSQMGYLGAVITHYMETLNIDGTRVNPQILDKAIKSGPGDFTYTFHNTYDFEEVFRTLGDSTVSGIFEGDARREGDYLVVTGIVDYNFYDEYSDPISFVEWLMDIFGLTREQAELQVEDSGDFAGTVYSITDKWRTKFNGCVKTG